MAKHCPGDILTCDWNPMVGCQRHTGGCTHCWFLDGIYPWQQRLGNIPADQQPDTPWFPAKRMEAAELAKKNGIIGVCQHGDLFWDRVPDDKIHQILDLVDQVAPEKIAKRRKRGLSEPHYVLWTKRIERASRILCERYPQGVPAWWGIAVSLETQAITKTRLPHLLKVPGFKIAVFEPILGPVDLSEWVRDLDWVIVGSETGDKARAADRDWFRNLRDASKAAGKPFFIKQMGTNHRNPDRVLDGRDWTEFPSGFVK